MFHKTNLGRFGEALPCDIDGYVPEAGDHWSALRWDAMLEWDDDSWAEYVAEAVRQTEEAASHLHEWRGTKTKQTYTIGVFDGPLSEGGAPWDPADREIETDDPKAAARRELDDATEAAINSGEYKPGDVITVALWDSDDTVVAEVSHEIEGEGDGCIYCDTIVTRVEGAPPAVDAEAEWATIAAEHAADCEWVTTRAHRIDG